MLSTDTAPNLRRQVWVRPAAEMQFLYGNHVLKSGLGRITESTAAYTGVVVYSMADVPLGFGVAAKSTQVSDIKLLRGMLSMVIVELSARPVLANMRTPVLSTRRQRRNATSNCLARQMCNAVL